MKHNPTLSPRPQVRAVHCDYRATEETIYQALVRATAPMTSAWQRIRKAKRIGLKFNQDKQTHNRVYYEGQLQQLVSEKVARAFLRLLRERTDAELICSDVSAYVMYGADLKDTLTFAQALRDYGVTYADGTKPPYKTVRVPGGGLMFQEYVLPEAAVDVDEFISVAKLKNHAFMGVTLCTKNLFGLMPGEPESHTRTYFHHVVRMPYLLADLGKIFDPVLNVIDGMVGQAGQEWSKTTPHLAPGRVCNTLIVGDQIIATDACATSLMGHDPQSDWLTPPFHRDRNHLLVAAEGGFGTVDLNAIDFQSEVEGPLGEFFANHQDPADLVVSVRRTTAEQGLIYRDRQRRFVDQYAGRYILLQQGQVLWSDTVSNVHIDRRSLKGFQPNQGMYLKYVDPDESEGEQFDVYDHAQRVAA
ncbi:MAG: DUF362 domain-containing protein [Caldilineaceae bacterium]|nr:DUF362 domain-containing protein [Caldilineaceae bacterium]